jgi:hypothetical protein
MSFVISGKITLYCWILKYVVFKTIITYKALLYNSNIFYCIQYDKELTILPKTIAQILELKNGDFQINLVSIQEPLYYNESLCTCVDHFKM